MVDQVDGVGGRATNDDANGRRRPRGIRGALALPLAIVSTIAVTLGIAQPAEAATHQVKRQPKAKAQAGGDRAGVERRDDLGAGRGRGRRRRHGERHRGALRALDRPRCSRTTDSSWSSLIFPGQRLALPGGSRTLAAPPPSPAAEIAKHTVIAGDTVERHRRASTDSNSTSYSEPTDSARQSLIFPGETIVLPSTAATPVVEAPSSSPAPSPTVRGRRHARRRRGRHAVGPGRTPRASRSRSSSTRTGSTAPARSTPARRSPFRSRSRCVPVASVSMQLTDEMRANAVIIVETGRAPRRARPGDRRGTRRRSAGVGPEEPPPRRSRLAGPLPAATERGLGHRRRGARSGARDHGVLRGPVEPESRTHPWPARHRGLGVDDGHGGRPGGAVERAPRPLREVGGSARAWLAELG